MKKYPQLVAAVQAWQAVPWAIGDALLKEFGPPVNLGSGRCHDDLLTIRDAAEEMLQLGFTGEEFGVRQDPDNLLSWRLEGWLVKARDVAYQFPPDKRQPDLPWAVHSAAGHPGVLTQTMKDAPKGTRITVDYVRAMLKRQQAEIYAKLEAEARKEREKAEAELAAPDEKRDDLT
jgi:hypothetical protein